MPDGPEQARRLFFALWPDAAVRASLATVATKRLRRVKRVPPENLHLTLAFPGSVPPAVQACLETEAGRIVCPPFELCIDRAGYWPGPRISWVGPARVPDGLWCLVSALRTALGNCGLETEKRSFQPHVTLARKGGPAAVPGAFAPIRWSIGTFSLVESVTDPAGAKYFPLRSWTLEGG